MFKHILLPTDGSELSSAAVREGVRFAKSIGARVTGLTVMPVQHTFFYNSKIRKETLDEVAKRFKEKADPYLKVIADAAREAGVECEVVYERSDSPFESII